MELDAPALGFPLLAPLKVVFSDEWSLSSDGVQRRTNDSAIFTLELRRQRLARAQRRRRSTENNTTPLALVRAALLLGLANVKRTGA